MPPAGGVTWEARQGHGRPSCWGGETLQNCLVEVCVRHLCRLSEVVISDAGQKILGICGGARGSADNRAGVGFAVGPATLDFHLRKDIGMSRTAFFRRALLIALLAFAIVPALLPVALHAQAAAVTGDPTGATTGTAKDVT